jgi:hypothetical protein
MCHPIDGSRPAVGAILGRYPFLSHQGGSPKEMGPVTIAVFEDGCGNLIQLAQATPAQK